MNESLPNVEEYEKELKNALKADPVDVKRVEELYGLISEGHKYEFVGRVGLFCPIKSGLGGGLLMREKDNKYYAVTGTKGYRWLEAEEVKRRNMQDSIDISYYLNLCSDAMDAIDKYADFEWFISDMEYDKENNGILPF